MRALVTRVCQHAEVVCSPHSVLDGQVFALQLLPGLPDALIVMDLPSVLLGVTLRIICAQQGTDVLVELVQVLIHVEE